MNIQMDLFLSGLIIGLGILKIAEIVRDPSKLTILNIAILSGVFAFGIQPTVIIWVTGVKSINVNSEILLRTYGAIWLFMIGIILIAYFDQRLVRKGKISSKCLHDIFLKASYIDSRFVIIIFTICISVRIIIASFYGVLFPITKTPENIAALPYASFTLLNCAELLEWGCSVWACWMIFGKKEAGLKFIAGIILFILFVMYFFEGRRWILAFFGQIFCIDLIKTNRLKFKLAISVLIVVTCLYYLLFPFFLKFRETHSMFLDSKNAITDFVNASNYLFHNEKSVSGLFETDQFVDNLMKRPSVRGFLFDVLERQEIIFPLHGEALRSVFEWSIPRFLFKEKLLQLPTEQYIQSQFGLRMLDTSISWVAVGVADFGIIGGLLIGLVLGLLLFLFALNASWFSRQTPFLALCFVGGLMNLIVIFEEDPTKLIVLFRNVWILFGVLKIGHFFKAAVRKRQKTGF